MNPRYHSAVESCISCIEMTQQVDGSFGNVIFSSAIILCCISAIKDNLRIKNIANKGISFLLKEKSDKGTWNYWKKESEKSLKTPCPDDLDDTALALAALTLHTPEHINSEVLVILSKNLITCETSVGGPYNTWILSSPLDTWKDVDLVVNSNIGFLLSLHEIYLPNLEQYVEEYLISERYDSKYYPNPLTVLYSISRFYQGYMKDKAIALISKQKNDGREWSNPLDASLALSAYLNFGGNPQYFKEDYEYLLDFAHSKKWEAFPLYIEEHKGNPIFAQSKAITAAFVLEAITKYKHILNYSKIVDKEKEKIKKEIIQTLIEKYETCTTEMSTSISKIVDEIITNDPSDQILLLPYYFWKTLSLFEKDRIPTSILINLGMANVCGWASYKIYDDLLDDEGDPFLLPVAHILIRETILIYKTLLPANSFKLFEEIMMDIDESNTWERKYCRRMITYGEIDISRLPLYGDYSTLAKKSLGHALGPLCIQSLLGDTPSSKKISSIKKFFIHYLIARQLNDDAHDWFEDLKRGFLNSTSVLILHLYKKKHPDCTSLNIKESEQELQELFCHQVIEQVALLILKHVTSARKIGYFPQILTPIEQVALKAIKEKNMMEDFLNNINVSKHE